MPDKIRVGIVGANINYGWGTRAHLPALKGLPEYEVVAVCTSHEETARETARRFGIPLAFHDVESMAGHKDVDLIDVCIRVPYHHQVVMTALEAGKHVFCEWPLGANLTQAVEMRDLAKARKVSNAVGVQARGSPMFNYVKDLVTQGYIGQVGSCVMVGSLPGSTQRTAASAWIADPTKGANTLTIQGGHSIDALCYCLGDFREVSSVVATQTKEAVIAETREKLKINSPDHVLVSGVLKSGALASVFIGSVPYHGTGFSFQIHGTDGSLVVTGTSSAQIGDLTLHGGRASDKSMEEMPIPAKYQWVSSAVPAGPPFNVGQLLKKQADSIRSKSPLANDFDQAVRLHTLLDAIQRASATGQRQTL